MSKSIKNGLGAFFVTEVLLVISFFRTNNTEGFALTFENLIYITLLASFVGLVIGLQERIINKRNLEAIQQTLVSIRPDSAFTPVNYQGKAYFLTTVPIKQYGHSLQAWWGKPQPALVLLAEKSNLPDANNAKIVLHQSSSRSQIKKFFSDIMFNSHKVYTIDESKDKLVEREDYQTTQGIEAYWRAII